MCVDHAVGPHFQPLSRKIAMALLLWTAYDSPHSPRMPKMFPLVAWPSSAPRMHHHWGVLVVKPLCQYGP